MFESNSLDKTFEISVLSNLKLKVIANAVLNYSNIIPDLVFFMTFVSIVFVIISNKNRKAFIIGLIAMKLLWVCRVSCRLSGNRMPTRELWSSGYRITCL